MNLKLILLTVIVCPFFGILTTQNLKSEINPNPQNFAEIFVEQSTFEFGLIEQGEVIQNVFEITNTGTEPLVISNAKGSCGCTVPNWPKEPVMPGETAQILVKIDSKGKKGKQSKRVTITANTDPAQTFLTVRGEVEEPETEKAPAVNSSASEEDFKNTRVDVNNFVLYPNPTAETLNVELKTFQGQSAEIQIFNPTGQLVNSKIIQEVQNEIYSFDVSNYSPGIYVVSTRVEGKMRVAKQISIVK